MSIINHSHNLEQLRLSKNFINSDCGKPLKELLKKSKKILKLQLDFNELMVEGTKYLAEGLIKNTTLEHLNIKGNVIGD